MLKVYINEHLEGVISENKRDNAITRKAKTILSLPITQKFKIKFESLYYGDKVSVIIKFNYEGVDYTFKTKFELEQIYNLIKEQTDFSEFKESTFLAQDFFFYKNKFSEVKANSTTYDSLVKRENKEELSNVKKMLSISSLRNFGLYKDSKDVGYLYLGSAFTNINDKKKKLFVIKAENLNIRRWANNYDNIGNLIQDILDGEINYEILDSSIFVSEYVDDNVWKINNSNSPAKSFERLLYKLNKKTVQNIPDEKVQFELWGLNIEQLKGKVRQYNSEQYLLLGRDYREKRYYLYDAIKLINKYKSGELDISGVGGIAYVDALIMYEKSLMSENYILLKNTPEYQFGLNLLDYMY